MSIEEAIELLENLKVCKQAHTLFNIEKEAVDMAIEALQENESLARTVNEASDLLRKQRPHGEWIPCKSTRTGQVTNIDYKCSKCSHHKDRPMPYCEICGSIMKRREAVKRNETAESR